MVKTKICSKCGEEKPLTVEYWYKRKESPDGFRADCFVCNSSQRKEKWAIAHPKKEKVRPTHKVCPTCKESKLINNENFSKNKRSGSGFHNQCKSCVSKIKKLKPAFKKVPLPKTKRCKLCGLDKELNTDNFYTSREHRYGFGNYCIECQSTYNRVKSNKEYQKTYREENKEYYQKLKLQWNKDHPHYYSVYSKERKKTDLNFKLRCSISNRIGTAIKSNTKSGRTLELLGCSIEFVRSYIEGKFQEGMTWDNYGLGNDKWNIDHRIPCSYFDLSDPAQQIKCFHYTNLQPMWQTENFAKKAKILYPIDDTPIT